MKLTCIKYTNTNEYNFHTRGFHQTLLYSDEINNFDIEIHHVLFWFVACKIYDATGGKLKS